MKNKISSLFIFLLLISTFNFIKSDNLLLKLAQNDYAKTLIDLIILKKDSDISDDQIKTEITSILQENIKELSIIKSELMTKKSECEKNISEVNSKWEEVKLRKITSEDRKKLKEKEFEFFENYRNMIFKQKKYMEDRKENNHRLLDICSVRKQEKNFKTGINISYIEREKNSLEEIKNIIYEISEKVENFDYKKQKDLIPYFKSNISNVDDINNFFVPILKNILILLEKSGSVSNSSSSHSLFAFLKKLKNLVKQKITEIEALESECNLVYESENHKITLELKNNLQHFEQLDKSVKDHRTVLEQEEKDFKFVVEKFEKLDKLIKIYQNSCKDNQEILEGNIKKKKEEISMSKMIKEFARNDLDKILLLNKDDDSEDES
jgi:hypothetical protein